ncbi:YchJ family protein [Hylemonella sp. W303a]|uniref:YchJ family protein n=1 Tax=Hylemonella sp. W303a TaxID=3389873 RepID=UPI00396B4284
MPATTHCPCGRGLRYASCCERWHGKAPEDDSPQSASPLAPPAPSPLALMRSRYSAFVLGRKDYLLATWHPDTRPAALHLDPATRWLGLEVRAAQEDGDRGTVEFVARSKLGGRATRLHEVSRFLRIAGRWFYLDGEFRA